MNVSKVHYEKQCAKLKAVHFYREHRGLEVCKLLFLFLFLFLLLLFWRHFAKRL